MNLFGIIVVVIFWLDGCSIRYGIYCILYTEVLPTNHFIRANQPTRRFLLGPSFLHLGSGFGNLGSLSVANSLFGWQLRAAVGQLTTLQKEDFLTRLFVPYVIKLMKQYSIPWLLLFSQGRFGQLSFMCWACFPLHGCTEARGFSFF